jgi:hypothetical protein
VWPDGRTAAVIVSGQRRGIQDAVLDVIVDSVEQADKLQAMFGDRTAAGPCRCCVSVPGLGMVHAARHAFPRPFFAGCLDPSEQDVNYTTGMGEKIAFAMTGDESVPADTCPGHSVADPRGLERGVPDSGGVQRVLPDPARRES